MKGFKDSTRTQYSRGGSAVGPKGAAKVSKVMREFKAGDLHSGSKTGPMVKDRKQAVAIALSESGRKPMKKAEGGVVKGREKFANDAERSRMMIASEVGSDHSVFNKDHKSNGMREYAFTGKPKRQSPQDVNDYLNNRDVPKKPMKKAKGGVVDTKQDKKAVAAGVHKHERHLHPGKPLTKLQRGGSVPAHSDAPLIRGR